MRRDTRSLAKEAFMSNPIVFFETIAYLFKNYKLNKKTL